jgi:hypothetical protein
LVKEQVSQSVSHLFGQLLQQDSLTVTTPLLLGQTGFIEYSPFFATRDKACIRSRMQKPLQPMQGSTEEQYALTSLLKGQAQTQQDQFPRAQIVASSVR